MKNINSITFYHDKRAVLIRLVGCIVILVCSLAASYYLIYHFKGMQLKADTQYKVSALAWLSVSSAVLTFFAIGNWIRKYVAHMPMLMADEHGIKFSGYAINWSEVEALSLYTVQRQQYVGIVLTDPATTLADYSFWKKIMCDINFYFSNAHFSFTDLDTPADQAYALLKDIFEQNEAAQCVRK